MKTYYNPHAARGGIYIEPWLLARRDLSYGAMIYYGVLASGAQGDGTTLVDVRALGNVICRSAAEGRARIDELCTLGLLEIERSPGDLVRCRFPAHRWITPVFHARAGTAAEEDAGEDAGDDSEERGATTHYRARRLHPADEPVRSRHALEECHRFVVWRKDQGEPVRKTGGFARHLHRMGYRDDEIAAFLRHENTSERAGGAEPPDTPGDAGTAVMFVPHVRSG